MEEMDLKWQVAMISMRIKKFHKRTGRKLQFDTKDPIGFDKTKVECFNCHKMGNFARDCRAKRIKIVEEEMLCTRETKLETIVEDMHIKMIQNLWLPLMERILTGSDNEVKSCSKTCEESYAKHKKLYDKQRDKLGDASVEITAYTLALKRLLNTQMSANDKFRLGYEDYRYGSILSYENKVLQSVFMNKTSDLKDTSINDRYTDGMHAVPLLMTGNYMPSRPNVEIDNSKFTYVSKQTSVDESYFKPSEYASCESDSSIETTTSMPEPVENAPKVVCKPKVWTDAPIFEEYESDSDNDSVSNVQEDKEKPSFTNSVKHVKTSRDNVKELGTPNHNPKLDKQDRNGHTRKGLGYAFTRKA
nr:ribonuclease H-like domain-containing protein [Tanacetum cinerariifolium]